MSQAMGTMGFTDEDQENILTVVAAVLHSSNIALDALSDDECRVNDNIHTNAFADLLGFTYDNLNRALCYFEIQVGKEKHQRKVPRSKAEKGLEALVKSLYGALFEYIVESINKSIVPKSANGASSMKKAASIGILGKPSFSNVAVGNCSFSTLISSDLVASNPDLLDIFGFESFTTNSFEQVSTIMKVSHRSSQLPL